MGCPMGHARRQASKALESVAAWAGTRLAQGEGMLRRTWMPSVLGATLFLLGGAAAAGVEAFDVGGEHACALDSCGEVQCWGYNGDFGELEGMSGDFVDLAVGTDHNCALEPGGTAVCWGRADAERLEPPYDDFKDIESGGSFTCGIRADDSIACWGGDGSNPDTPPGASPLDGPESGVHYGQMSLGYDYGCAITTGRRGMRCWGASVPLGVRNLLASEVMVSATERFRTVSAGGRHVCFTSDAGRVYCFGDNAANQLMPDYPLSGSNKEPGSPAGDEHVVRLQESYAEVPFGWFPMVTWGGGGVRPFVHDVSAGLLGTCAVYSNGGSPRDTYCWGYPFQYGYGRKISPSATPDEVLLGGHQFCVWDHGNGSYIDCEWEFSAYETDPDLQIPDLSCGS